MGEPHHVIIIGGGFAGLYVARGLAGPGHGAARGDIGNGRRLSDVLLPNLLGFAVARIVPAPFALVSSIYMDPATGAALRVDAPVDVASSRRRPW